MTIRGDDKVTIATGEAITDDLLVTANQFVLDGNATMDVFVMARDVVINGDVGGAVTAAGATIEINGDVNGSVRIFGGTATVSGTIDGDLLMFGGSATIEPTGSVGGDVNMHGGSLTAKGPVGGDVLGSVESLALESRVDGDVSIRTGDLDVAPTGEVGGKLSYVSGSDADIAPGATIAGAVDRSSIAPWGADGSARGKFFSPLVRTVWLLITGAVLIALAPRLASALDMNMRRPLASLIIGAIALVGIPIIAILLAITVIGLPVSLILIALYFVALYLSQYVVGQRIGGLLLPGRWNDGSRGYLLLSMTIGVLLLSVLRYLPVPFVGTIVNGLVAVVGLGASIMLLRQVKNGATSGEVALR
jgi:cytoskeletal protein CcmA (bactofilin family)